MIAHLPVVGQQLSTTSTKDASNVRRPRVLWDECGGNQHEGVEQKCQAQNLAHSGLSRQQPIERACERNADSKVARCVNSTDSVAALDWAEQTGQ